MDICERCECPIDECDCEPRDDDGDEEVDTYTFITEQRGFGHIRPAA